MPDAEVPVTEGWRLSELPPAAAAARSADACETPPPCCTPVVLLPACPCVEIFADTPLPAADTLVEGVDMLLLLTEEEDLCLREGVGCVAPVIWCVGLGSEISTGSSEAEVEVEECDALLATEADWARRAVSSRVRRLTWVACVSL